MPHSHIRVITVFRSLRDESPTPRDLDKQEAVPVLQIGPVASSVKLPRLGTFGAGGFVVSCSPYIFLWLFYVIFSYSVVRRALRFWNMCDHFSVRYVHGLIGIGVAANLMPAP